MPAADPDNFGLDAPVVYLIRGNGSVIIFFNNVQERTGTHVTPPLDACLYSANAEFNVAVLTPSQTIQNVYLTLNFL